MSRGFYVTATPLAGIGAAYKLPMSAFAQSLGWVRDAQITQAPESEVGILYGDNTRTIEPLQVRLQLVASNERAASDLLTTILAQCAASSSILRYDGYGAINASTTRRRDYLRFKSFKGDPQLGQQHVLPVTLEFLPTLPYWTDLNGGGDFPF